MTSGIIRRIDDLGRIVIPKEIRKVCGVREGDPLEVSTDGKSVIFTLYTDENEAVKSAFNTISNYLNEANDETAQYLLKCLQNRITEENK